MPKFSKRSLAQLATCNESLQRVCMEAIKEMDFTCLEGHRDQAAQNKAYDSGHSKLRWPDGKHNDRPSRAIDIVPYPAPYANIKDNIFLMGYVLGIADAMYHRGEIEHKCRVGCDWDRDGKVSDESFLDASHLEIIV